MTTKKISVGIDLGSQNIRIVAGEWKDEEFQLHATLTLPAYGISKGKIINVERTAQTLREGVDKLQKDHHIEVQEATFSLSGSDIHVLNKRVQINQIAEGEITMGDIIKLKKKIKKEPIQPDRKIIHILPQSYCVDNDLSLNDPIGISGTQLSGTFSVITAPINRIQNIKKAAERGGIEVKQLIYTPLAATHFLTQAERKAGVCLIDLGSDTTNIVIYTNNSLRSIITIPLGSNTITQDIQQGCLVTKPYAEELKIKHGSAIESAEDKGIFIAVPGLRNRPPKKIPLSILNRIIQARAEELGHYIALQIHKINAKLGGSIVLTGGGAQLNRLEELLTCITGYDARVSHPEHNQEGNIETIGFATAIGLTMANENSRSYGLQENNSQKERKTKKKKRKGILQWLFGSKTEEEEEFDQEIGVNNQ